MTDVNPDVVDPDDDNDDETSFVDDDVEATDPPLDPTEPSQFANNTVLQDDLDDDGEEG